MTKSVEALDVPLRAVDLLSDCEGAYGIGINPSAWVKSFICNEHYDLIDDEIHDVHRPLMLRPDVIRASAVFPNKCRSTLLHTIGNKCWAGSYEWAVLKLMHSAALARNERLIELREREHRKAQRGKRLDEEVGRFTAESNGDKENGSSSCSMA